MCGWYGDEQRKMTHLFLFLMTSVMILIMGIYEMRWKIFIDYDPKFSRKIAGNKTSRDTPLHAADSSCLNNCLARSDLCWPGLDVRMSEGEQIIANNSMLPNCFTSFDQLGLSWFSVGGSARLIAVLNTNSHSLVWRSWWRLVKIIAGFIQLILFLFSHSEFVMMCPGREGEVVYRPVKMFYINKNIVGSLRVECGELST